MIQFGFSQATRSRILNHALDCLSIVLPTMFQARIRPPSLRYLPALACLAFRRVPQLYGCVGFIDGRAIKIQRPKSETVQEVYYNGHKHFHCIKELLVFATDGTIIFNLSNVPGKFSLLFVGLFIHLFLNISF